MGIGLSFVQALVQRHNGRVEARSAGPGQGSEFIVRLPALEPDARAPAAIADQPEGEAKPSTPVHAPLRVLVVDDNEDAAQSLRELLRH